MTDGRMHEGMLMLGGLLGLLTLAALAIYFLGRFLALAILYVIPKS